MRAIYMVPLVAILLSGCLKDDLDPAALNNNPFDAEYAGPAIFSFDTTFIEFPTGEISRQVFQFKVNSALFLEPQAYAVYVEDLGNGSASYVQQFPAGSHTLRYYKGDYQAGVETCLRLSLSNNYHQSRAETICGTLQ